MKELCKELAKNFIIAEVISFGSIVGFTGGLVAIGWVKERVEMKRNEAQLSKEEES